MEALDDIRIANHMNGPLPVFDPARRFLFYTKLTGCGYENEGRTMFVANLAIGKSFPILASCGFLTAGKFLEYQGKYYLAIGDGNGGTSEGSSFWLYDLEAGEFVIHAEGVIEETEERGVYSYGYYGSEETVIQLGNVTMKNLLNREKPLRLLSDYPLKMHGLTLRTNTKVVHTFSECFQDDTSPPEFTIIRKAGTKVFVISTCEDGSYEIYYNGVRGNVAKGSLKLTK
jgi:hypothetical protein